jgi:aryl-alcohol dehydrogenase-like predicted oxidoreductase
VDLYYIHRLDKITPIEKTVAAMVELKNEGKIKYLGLSECSANTLHRALVASYTPPCAVNITANHIIGLQMQGPPHRCCPGRI